MFSKSVDIAVDSFSFNLSTGIEDVSFINQVPLWFEVRF